MVLKRQSVMTTNERQKVKERRQRDEGKMDTMLYFIARGAKHAGKCLESMVSADPKALYISEKQTKHMFGWIHKPLVSYTYNYGKG